MPQMGIQPIPTDFRGPLPRGTVGLILGHSSLTMKGLVVHPGVVDQDYEGELRVLCSSPQGVFSISSGDGIAQLVVLPGLHDQYPSSGPPRGTQRFGTSGSDLAYLVVNLDTQPVLELQIEGKSFKGILDTGAEKSIVSSCWWPKSWPLIESPHPLRGLGYEASPTISSRPLRWRSLEGQLGEFTPFVLPLPVNLWGRDILLGLGLTLTNEYLQQAMGIMRKMGYREGKGLGKEEQGRLDPLPQEGNVGRQGLGFF
ncbi:endogenous retrovirus group K member 7 Pro protein-like [Apodemus sylvaticus]|uniref:endogenous retrovirus group K member 7 Pro protein-like n=1 Tax=Apodemus sylvaticus TaxID=10129 RepID=UPI0022444684|nr:endogenous retrovirus group K member 7 Pro protein-like [Apodemus sylvaticus]